MKEQTLITFLIVVGIISLIVIVGALTYMGIFGGEIVRKVFPFILCRKDPEGGYILAKPTGSELCDFVNDIDRLGSPELCEYYENDMKTACIELTEIVQKRTKDCLWGLFKNTTTLANLEDVEKYCQTLEEST